MVTADETTELMALRRAAEDLGRAEDWAGYLDLVPRLRQDTEQWAPRWAPVAGISAKSLHRDDEAYEFLDEAIAGGFFQPILFEPEISNLFGADAGWDMVLSRMSANIPPPPVELLGWPSIAPHAPLALFRLETRRERELATRLPDPASGAWETARKLLAWVTNRWVHANDHVDDPDAVDILDRVDEGQRFACVEYSIVLSQALNAVAIPSRRVSVRMRHHHAGIGAGHVVSEAWIDDLGSWVLLDGQNGIYWHDGGTPLGLVELLDRRAAGEPRPEVAFVGAELDAPSLDLWWAYFASASTTGADWGSPTVVPVFEGRPQTSQVLLADNRRAYPDMGDVAVSTDVVEGSLGIRLHTDHPFAVGFRMESPGGATEITAEDAFWRWPAQSAGEHSVEISTVTPYGCLRPRELRYRTM